MTERKPPGVSWESHVERQLREAEERGEFDDLAGKGKPLPGIDEPHDELWWVKQLLRREQVSALPPTLELRRQVEEARAQIENAPSEAGRARDRRRHQRPHPRRQPQGHGRPADAPHAAGRRSRRRVLASITAGLVTARTPPGTPRPGPGDRFAEHVEREVLEALEAKAALAHVEPLARRRPPLPEPFPRPVVAVDARQVEDM